MKTQKLLLVSVIAITVMFAVSVAKPLPKIVDADKGLFKNLVKDYLHPEMNAWGIGLNTAKDSYIVAKLHVTSVKTLPRSQIVQILKDAKAGDITTWGEVKDKIKEALDASGVTTTSGRIQVNKVQYVLTDIARTDTTFAATIREKPVYLTCTAANKTAAECDEQAATIGDLSLTKKDAEFENKQKIWAGTMNFNNTAYTFVALVQPKGV
ncbi:MAG: hypothetical protein V1900_01815 [Candidatus Aenigmatarchaeota archaeon]